MPARIGDLRSRTRPTAAEPDSPESTESATSEQLSPEVARWASFLAHAAEVTLGAAVFGPPDAPTTTPPPNRRLRTTRVSGGRFYGAFVFERADRIHPLAAETARRRNNRDATDLAERLSAFYNA